MTKGNIIVEDIKVGDIHYEYYGNTELKTIVKTLPQKTVRDDDNYWTWTSLTDDGVEITYGVSDKYYYYGPNIYDYRAYVKIDELNGK